MRIAINAYFLTRPFTGLGKYTRGLLNVLDSSGHGHEIIAITPERVDRQFSQRVELVDVPLPRQVGPSIGKFWWEQWIMPKTAKNHQVDFIHHFYPATSVLTLTPQIISAHDATPWHFPAHNYSAKIRWFRKFTMKASRRAKLIVTVSNTAKEDIAKVFDIPERKIRVIYNGIDENFRHTVSGKDKSVIAKKYSINFPYIFYIGGFEVHKNVRQLFLAYTKAASEIDEHLVLAGGIFSKTRPPVYKDYFELPELIKNYKLEHRVHMIGAVPDEDLPALYQGANLYVSSSLAEGFNIPLVEAMASKIPIICANIPVNHEIAIDEAGRKAAMFVDTKNVNDLAMAIIKILHDQKKQKELIANAWARQKEFTWRQAGQKLIDLYDTFH
jgi:glycosyltransferase involved in cell wall biosynthesis